jgi:hypothetical protein
MKIKIHKKAIVFGIIIILFCSTIFPGISSKKVKPEQDEITNDKISEVEEELATLTFNTFNENGKKENKIELPISKAKYIFNLFEKLRNNTISEPNSQETLDLKNRFINLLEEYGLIPSGMSTSDIQPLINPHGSPDNPRSRGRTGFLGLIFEVLFSNRFNHLRLFGPLDYPSEWSIVCNVAGGGYGIPLPLFILPRPRAITVWGATFATTAVGSLLMPKSFIAIGNQQGICLGFVGVGITIAFFGFMGYGMLGYSLYTAVRAQEIERYNNKPTITNENPPDGSINVPISLSELRFRLTDGDGDLMSYSVTTSPNIGSGSANNKGNGFYSIPVSGLDSDTDYTWHVSVDDGYDIVDKTFSFRTEAVAPVISNPSPSDGAMDVSVDISQLSFHLKDYQGDLMDYTVTTIPDIGSGSGNGVGDGTYTVDVSGIDYSTEYTWYITVTDGEHQTNKEFNFQTEYIMVFDPFEMGWQYRKKITIDHSKVDGDLTSFPVLISTVDEDLCDKAQSDGDDILFMDGPGVANRLYHEIEYYDDSNGELVAWVNIPSLSANEDTVLYMYYGNPSCSSQQFPENVWNTNYCGVWHLSETSGQIIDSSFNDNDGTNLGAAYGTIGKISKALDFECDDPDRIIFPHSPSLDLESEVTIELWFKPESFTYDKATLCTKHTSYYTNILTTGQVAVYTFWNDGGSRGPSNWMVANTPIAIDNWHHIVWSESDNGLRKIYINGLLDVQGNYEASIWSTSSKTFLGHNDWNENERRTDGILDEVRISKIARSEDWIITTYNNQNDPSSFYNIGPEESAL